MRCTALSTDFGELAYRFGNFPDMKDRLNSTPKSSLQTRTTVSGHRIRGLRCRSRSMRRSSGSRLSQLLGARGVGISDQRRVYPRGPTRFSGACLSRVRGPQDGTTAGCGCRSPQRFGRTPPAQGVILPDGACIRPTIPSWVRSSLSPPMRKYGRAHVADQAGVAGHQKLLRIPVSLPRQTAEGLVRQAVGRYGSIVLMIAHSRIIPVVSGNCQANYQKQRKKSVRILVIL